MFQTHIRDSIFEKNSISLKIDINNVNYICILLRYIYMYTYVSFLYTQLCKLKKRKFNIFNKVLNFL